MRVRPSSEAVLDAIIALRDAGPPIDLHVATRLLHSLPRVSIPDHFLHRLLIPADDGTLHPQQNTYYNDLGANAYLAPLPDGARRAHESVSRADARRLRLKDLSILRTLDDDEDDDYGERFSTRIKNALRQYSHDQLPAEFLANAIDAGATEMDIMVDERDFSRHSQRLMDPGLSACQSNGAIMFYNNSVFSGDDWKGIKRVGEGSKRNKSGKIGRFGLGALSAYHISEVRVLWTHLSCSLMALTTVTRLCSSFLVTIFCSLTPLVGSSGGARPGKSTSQI
jgi:hypothetical protein